MSSLEEKHFLRLIKFSYDLSLKVTRTFTKTSILQNYNNSIVDFLNAFKHEIYHLWNNKTRCCACVHNLCLQHNRELNKEQFTKLYDIQGAVHPGHFKMGKGNSVVQHCLCRITTITTCSLNDLDIILIHTIIRKSVKLSPDEDMWLQTIRQIRNNLAHAVSTTSFDKGRLEKWWSKLEGSVLGLAGKVPPLGCYAESIEDQIKLLKKIDLDTTDIEEFMVQITEENKKISEDVKKEIEKSSIENKSNLQQEHIKTRNQIIQLVEEKFENLTKLLCRISISSDLEESSIQIGTRVIEASCQVTGDNIDEELMLENIKQQDTVDQTVGFNITSAERKCIILELCANSSIFQSTEIFQQAINSLIKKIACAGELDISVPSSLEIDLTFTTPVTQDELDIISSLTSLQINVDIEQQMPIKQEQALCDQCNEQNKDISGVLWCPVCDKMLCSDCSLDHRSQMALRNHYLVDINFKFDLQTVLSKQQYCTTHSPLKLEYYCPPHDTVCCQECLADKHSSCKDVISLDIACQNGGKSFLEDIAGEMKNIVQTVKYLEDETNKDLSYINLESKNIQNKIVHAKIKASDHINECENKLLSELQIEQTASTRQHHDMKQKCKSIANSLITNSNILQFIKEHGTDEQAFLLMHNLKPALENINDMLSTIIKSAVVTTLKFDVPRDQIMSVPSLGSLSFSKQSLQVSHLQNKERFAQCIVPKPDKPLTSFKLTSTFKTSDTVNILGMTATRDEKLLLCNYTDKHEVLVYNTNGHYITAITMEHNPRDIAEIHGGDQYVVILPRLSSIQYINGKDLTPGKCVQLPTKSKIYGIATDKRNIYVGEYYEIFVLNHDGNVERKIRLRGFKGVKYIAVNDNNLYVSNIGDTIFCIDQNSTIDRTRISGAGTIRKIIVDHLGYIYVGGEESGIVHRLDKYLKEIMTIGAEGVSRIGAICFNSNYTKLFVASERGKTVVVFNCS